jgi:transcription elongation factor Elf1
MTQASSSSEAPWLKLARSHDPFEQQAQTFPKHPICPRCDVPMWLSKVRTKSKKVEYFYECKACEDKMTVTDD